MNNPITLDEAIWGLEIAKKNGWHGFVEVTIPGQKFVEGIVNHPSSIENKIAYYRKTYNSDGTHKMNPKIRMVNAGAISRYEYCKLHMLNPEIMNEGVNDDE